MRSQLDPRTPLYAAFFSMPLLMGLISHVVVPPREEAFPVALPDGTSTLHWALVIFALSMTVASVALGMASDVSPAGVERRANLVDPKWLIRLAMAETTAMAGFLATFLTQRPGAWVPFSTFSLIALVAARPK